MMRFDRRRLENCVVAALLLCAALLTAVGDADAARKKVSVSEQMVSVADVLRSVAGQAGVQLIMTRGVEAVIPMINIRNQPWDEAMKQIATKAGLHIWIEGDCAVVSKDKLGLQPRLSLIPEVSPARKITLDYERTPLPIVLEKIASDVGISILTLPGRGEDLIATKLPGRRTLSVRLKDVHWRKALELVARSTGCVVEAVADNVYVVKSVDVVLKAVNMSIQEVIHNISEQSGINVVISPTVKGNVTMNLVGVPWAEALDAIVTSLGLSWRQHSENTIMITGEARELKKVVGFFNINYVSGDDMDIVLKALSPEGETTDMAGLKPPWVLILNDEPHVLREVEQFLQRYDRPRIAANPVEFDLSRVQISIGTPEGPLAYDSKMSDVRKMLFYREFRRVIAPVLSVQSETSFLPVVDKIIVRDVPRNLAYVQQIVAEKFPPVERARSEKQLFEKAYALSVADTAGMAKVLRAQVGPGLKVEARDEILVVSATAREHKKVQEVLAAYDVEPARKEYSTLYKSIDFLVPLLKSRLSALAVIETDPLTSIIIVEAPAPDHAYTERFMGVQDVPAADAMSVKIFKLNFARAEQLAQTIQTFLIASGELFVEAEVKMPLDDGKPEAPKGVPESGEKGEAGPKAEPETPSPEAGRTAKISAKIKAVVLPDVGTNSLIVTARGADMPKIQNLIETLDREPGQVLIIGRIVETTVLNLSDIGLDINLSGSISGSTVPTTIPFEKRQTTLYDEIVPEKDPNLIGTEYPSQHLFAYAGVDDFKSFGKLSFSQLSATLSMLDEMSGTRLISSPRIVIVDNETATFTVTKSREYRKRGSVTQGEGGQVAFAYEYATADSRISIEITPQITPNGKILMKLKPEVVTFEGWKKITNPDGTEEELPTVVTRTTETRVIIDDGMTLVLAGLVENVKTDMDRQVPFLGKIPVLGRLFRKEINQESGRNLIFFFTPVIMKEESSYETGIEEIKTAYEKLGTIEKTEIIEWDRGAAETPRKKKSTLVRSAVNATDKPKKERRRRR